MHPGGFDRDAQRRRHGARGEVAEAKCGDSCSTSKFASTLKGLGKINVPNNALAGPLDFSKTNSGLTSAQVWQWDAASSKSVAKGQTFSIVV